VVSALVGPGRDWCLLYSIYAAAAAPACC
jgi:hypothetical protein